MALRKSLLFALVALIALECAGQELRSFHLVPALRPASCCCGQFSEIFFPNLDFESGPLPSPGTFFTYSTGANFGGWTVTQATIDHCDAGVGNLGAGNPNGGSFFIDLHGSPGLGGISYNLFGLTPGNQYRIEFWTAQNGGGFSSTGYLKVGGGAWLNVNWVVSVSGAVAWRKEMFEFTAQASSGTMEFSSTGPMVFAGTLVDDIKIFECPGDMEKPEVLNVPENLMVECESQVPKPPSLITTDNCDPNPKITLKETKETVDPCTKKITREWSVKDVCDNETVITQFIDIKDESPPQITRQPAGNTAFCHQDVEKIFNDWIKKNGNALASDACGTVNWRVSYDKPPGKKCDSLVVEFIATDPCGNESFAYATFTVKDTTKLRFIAKAKNYDVGNSPNPRDSLRIWLMNQGYALINSGCDTAQITNDFKGDSTRNPLPVWFFVKDACGHIDSCLATFSYQGANTCCCGQPTELFFSNLDFEAPPIAPPGGWIDYSAGDTYAGWNITTGSISIHDPGHLNLGAGNPNGATQHLDLHGSNQGSAAYTLTGLTAGSRYTISFWYAIHSFGANVSASLRVNGGSLLNVSWNASNPGNVNWLQAMHEFIADGPVATMEFIGTGATPCCGMLIDDVQIFECPNDNEKPEILTPLDDLTLECLKDVPKPPVPLTISDNCDLNPKVSFKESFVQINPCTRQITRTWEVKDACGNITTADQLIEVKDESAPVFLKNPEDKKVYCNEDVQKEFNLWVNKNANASAIDNCGAVSWRTSIERSPKNHCDTVLVEFFAIDHCGNEDSRFANFIVLDTSSPKFLLKPQNKQLRCVINPKDSLRAWLDSFAYSRISSDCDTVIKTYHFDGDSTGNQIAVSFYIKDRCGNIDSANALFTYRTASDTFRFATKSCTIPRDFNDTLYFSIMGCDSVVIVQNIRLQPDTTRIQTYTCDSASVGTDTLTLTNVSGCDSVIFRQVELKQKSLTLIDSFSCQYLNYRSDTLKLTGQYCDSTIITNFIPLRKDSVNLQQFTCDSSKAGLQIIRRFNQFGCDSIITIHTLLSGIQSTFRDTFECGLLFAYADSVIYHTMTCDSLVITQHWPRPIDSTIINSQTCDPSKAGLFIYPKVNRFGCDSTVIEQVTLLPSDSIKIFQSTCNFAQSGEFRDTLQNRFGCDSIVSRIVSFLPPDSTYVQKFTCDSFGISVDTLVFSTSTCDSIVFIRTTLLPTDTTILLLNTCNANQAGKDTLTLKNTNGCDSIIWIETLFVPSDTVYLQTNTCMPAAAGTDTTVLMNSKGCDSLILITRTFKPLLLEWNIDSINCFGIHDGRVTLLNEGIFSKPLTYILNGISVTQLNQMGPGHYELYISDQLGCVSDTILFDLVEPIPLVTDLGPDLEVFSGTTLPLVLQTNKILQQIHWIPEHPNQCNNCLDYTIRPEVDQWVYTFSMDERGCSSIDSVFIRILRRGDVYAPNVFSPNGDNLNDNFYLQGDEGIIIDVFQIYDRWGDLLFEATDIPINQPSLGWDGTYQGEKLNPGVFLFTADLRFPDGSKKKLAGDVTLLR